MPRMLSVGGMGIILMGIGFGSKSPMADEDLHQRLIDTASILLAVVEEVRAVQIAVVVQEESLGALNIE